MSNGSFLTIRKLHLILAVYLFVFVLGVEGKSDSSSGMETLNSLKDVDMDKSEMALLIEKKTHPFGLYIS